MNAATAMFPNAAALAPPAQKSDYALGIRFLNDMAVQLPHKRFYFWKPDYSQAGMLRPQGLVPNWRPGPVPLQ